MFVFKEIDKTASVIENNIVHYTHTFTTSSRGIKTHKIVSGSISSSYWSSLNVLFYTSGSPEYISESKFEKKVSNISLEQRVGEQHLSKYHGYPSSSIITIPSKYYGEKIKPKSFKFTDLNHTDNDGINPIIRDDGFGNLYSTNAHHSQSTNHASSSDNYVGNIFYEQGLAVITETGSWSGSVDYSDLATNYTLNIDSHNSITTHQYSVTIKPTDFNQTMNYSVRMPLSGTYSSMEEYTASLHSNPYLATEFTGSEFSPYITTINLYQTNDIDTPVIQARLPKPIRKSKKLPITFKIRLDM